jgi:uracil-DNA glycosylase
MEEEQMIETWEDLNYWSTGEWQVVQERLDDLEKAHVSYNPKREDLFRALDLTPFKEVRVCFLGQDPYPNRGDATGLAFSIPLRNNKPDAVKFPATLYSIFQEYSRDLSLPTPTGGDLSSWAKQGVLLWNVIPSCKAGSPLSHWWPEWFLLTQEILTNLSEKGGVIFVFFGAKAREFAKYVDADKNSVIHTSHPSPRGSLNSKSPFVGSRIFSTVNGALCQRGLYPINWRLP